MIDGILYLSDFWEDPKKLFDDLLINTDWDNRMKARKTASFGQAYNYSQIDYPYQKMPFYMVGNGIYYKNLNLTIE